MPRSIGCAHHRGPVLARIAASALVLVGLTVCSASVSVGGTPEVTAEDVDQQISDSLTESVGRAPDQVECPEALTAPRC